MKHLKVGEYDCFLLPDGLFRLDGGSMFGVVPKALWNNVFPADGQNRILLASTALLVAGKGIRLLVEGGAGDVFRGDTKLLKIYDIESTGTMDDELRKAGYTAEDITHVSYTHLHWDHAGNACRFNDSVGFVPRFPLARYIVQKGEWEMALSGHPANRGSYMPETLAPLEAAGLLDFAHGDHSLNSDISFRVTGGHTEHHQVMMLRSGNDRLIFWGDLIPTSKHAHIPHIMAYDRLPLQTYDRKKQLLEETCAEGYISAFPHDPEPSFARIRFDGRRYSSSPIQ